MMHRALTDQQRRGAFVVAAVLLLGVVAVMSALDGGRHRHGDSRNAASAMTRSPASSAPRIVDASAPTTSATASTSTTSTTATTSTATRNPRPGGVRRLILADARRFLSAYLVYEVRPLDARGRAMLRASTTPGFARHLLRVRVNLPARNRPAVGRVRTLRVQDRPGRTTATVGATVQNGAWVSGLMMRMRSRDGQWLVAGLK